MAGSRNFATKLWNAARFTLGQIEGKVIPASLEGRRMSLPDRWILSRLSATTRKVNRDLAGFRFDEAAQSIYAFVWHEFCDGYLEMVKPLLSSSAKSPTRQSRYGDGAASEDQGSRAAGEETAKETSRAILARCLSDSLRLLHPFMPFVTEEIWEKTTGRPGTLIAAAYPQEGEAFRDDSAERVVEALRALVTRVRNFRTERGFSPTEPVQLAIDPDSPDPILAREIETLFPLLRHLARLSDISLAVQGVEATGSVGTLAPATSRDVLEGLSIRLSVPQSGAGADRRKVGRTLAALDGEIAELSAKLHNTAFLDKAPPAVVEKTRKRLVELEERRSALSAGGA